MKYTALAAFCLGLWGAFSALGQLPSEARLGNNFSISKYRDTPNGRVLDMLLLGNESTPLTKDVALVTPFEMISFRNGQTNLTAEAPQCHLDHVSDVAWDASHLKLYTPTTNVFIQGDGFFFTQSNHVLILSNNVETQVVRALLKSSMLSGKETNSLVRIYSDFCRFDSLSNHADYAGKVHVIDPQMDVTSDYLSIQLGTNGAIETIRARQNVVIVTTNKGRATGDMALYRIVDGSEITDLTGNAFWQNGDEQAKAEHFNYDSARHLLSATNHVRVRWPNVTQADSGAHSEATSDRILYAEDAVMQLPPTNGPVESLVANGSVIIVNQADQSRSTGDHAVYSRADNLFQLTGSPVWWNDHIKVQGETLNADVTNKIYHARGHSRFEMAGGRDPSQLLVITATNIDYQTNLAVFQIAVHATLSEAGLLRDTLDCDLLNVDLLSNEAITAVATGNVRGQTAPDRTGNVKAITCASLTAHRSPVTLLMRDLIATNDVVLTQLGDRADAPRDKLTAASVIAEFFAATNQIEKAVAQYHVVFEQLKPDQTLHATAARADYSATNDQVVLTGTPVATTDRYIITDADHLVWQPRTNRFRAFGLYNIVPVKPKSGHPSS
jgi:lipopolysaccharide export system protein LptA